MCQTRLWSVCKSLLEMHEFVVLYLLHQTFVTLKEVFPLSLLHGETGRKLRFLLQLRPWEDFLGPGPELGRCLPAAVAALLKLQRLHLCADPN